MIPFVEKLQMQTRTRWTIRLKAVKLNFGETGKIKITVETQTYQYFWIFFSIIFHPVC